MPFLTKLLSILGLVLLIGLGHAFAQSGVAYYVSPTGNDSYAGTRQAPFGTLEYARDRVRATRTGTNTATIWLMDGTFYRTNAFALTSAETNLLITAVPGASPRLCGGVKLDPAWFAVVTSNSPVWPRLDATAKGVVLQANLTAQGLTNLGVIRVRNGLGGLDALNPGPLTTELFVNEKPMELGRWPNGSVAIDVAGASTNSFKYTGTRPTRWVNAPDPWYHGWWYWLWDDNYLPGTGINTNTSVITMSIAPKNGFQNNNPWYALNLLEEVDTPGEYYLDRTSGLLYLWPTANFVTSEVMLNQMDVPLITLSSVKNVTISGLSLYCARGNLLTTDNGCANVLFNQGRLIGAGLDGAVLSGGSNIVINLSEIAYIGQIGVMVNGGGNQYTLVPCNNAVQNCRIHDFARLKLNYTPAVSVYGTGFKVLHNEIYSAPGMGITYFLNNHLIAYNDIHDVCQWVGDMGAIYSGAWEYQGNRTVNNFIHEINSPLVSMSGYGVSAVYLDQCGSGREVASNVIYNVSATVLINNGGRDNHYYNNIVARCGTMFYSGASGPVGGVTTNTLNTLKSLNYQQPPWSTAYPALAAVPNTWSVLTNDPSRGSYDWRVPGGCVFTNNVGWQNVAPYGESGSAFSYFAAITNNLTNSNPLFVDESALDLRLQSNSPAFSLPGFGDLQFLSIGPPWPNLTTQRTAYLQPGLATVQAWVNLRGDSNSVIQCFYGTNDFGAATNGWSACLNTNVATAGGAGWVTWQVPAGMYARVHATNSAGETWSDTALLTPTQPPFPGLTWQGGVSGIWNSTTANWQSNGVATTYTNGADVLFDDTLLGNPTITGGDFTPKTVTFNNSLTAYNLSTARIMGTNSVTKNGTNTAVVNSIVNSGAWTVNAGTLSIGTAYVYPTGYFANQDILVNNGGTLLLGGNGIWGNWYAGNSGRIRVNSGGTLATAGFYNVLWNLALNGGTVLLNGGGAPGFGQGDTALILEGTLTNTGVSSINVGTGGTNYVTVGGGYAASLTVNSVGATDSLTVNAPLQGVGTLTKTGLGILTLNSSNSYAGVTTVNAGTLKIGGAGQLGAGLYAAKIVNNGSVQFDSSAGQTLSGVISGSGWLTHSGAGTLTLMATNTYTGNTTNSAGALVIGGTGQLGSGLYAAKILNNGVLQFDSSANQTLSGVISGGGWLTHSGAGTLTLTATNTYTGNTTNSAGTLELAQSVPTLATNSTVAIASGAVLKLTVGTVTNRVAVLITNGVAAAAGLYNSANSSGFITGPGYLRVGPSGPGRLTNSVSGGVLSLAWPAGQGWRLQMQTNSLSKGLSTNWQYLTDGTKSSTNIPLDMNVPATFYRLAYP